MVKFVVMYGQPEDPAPFDAHYADSHAPREDPEPATVRGGQGGRNARRRCAAVYFLAELSFDDAAAMQAAMGSAKGQAAGADAGTFATGGATVMIVEV